MLQFFDTLTDDSGNSLLGATVTVTNYPSGTLATIYSANGTASPIANSVVAADITGQVSFYAPDGAYTLTYAYKSTVYKTRSPVQLIDPMGFVAATDSGAANAIVVNGAQYPAQKYVGLKLEVKVAATNTGATTLNFQGDGGLPVTQPGGAALVAGMLVVNGLARFEWDGAEWQYVGVISLPTIFAQTTQEAAALITPTNFSINPVPEDPRRFGADPTGVADSRTAFNSLSSVGQPGVVQAGTYLINSNVTIGPFLEFKEGAILKPAAGVVITLSNAFRAGVYQIFDLSLGGLVALPRSCGEVWAEWWGAKGDLVKTNNEFAFNAAWYALLTSTLGYGGTINFDRGYFYVSGTTYCSDNIAIRGHGMFYSTILVHANWVASLIYAHQSQSAAYAANQISGLSGGQLSFTAAVPATAVSATLASAFLGTTGVYPVVFFETAATGCEQRQVTLTNGATTATWSGGLANNCTNYGVALGQQALFNQRIEQCRLHCNDNLNIQACIYAPAWQQKCGTDNVYIQSVAGHGILQNFGYGGAAQLEISRTEIFLSPYCPASSYCINMSLPGTVGWFDLNLRQVQMGSLAAPVNFTAPPNAAATSATLTANWPYPTGTWNVQFVETAGGAIESRLVTLTNGATTATWSGGLANNCNAAATGISPYGYGCTANGRVNINVYDVHEEQCVAAVVLQGAANLFGNSLTADGSPTCQYLIYCAGSWTGNVHLFGAEKAGAANFAIDNSRSVYALLNAQGVAGMPGGVGGGAIRQEFIWPPDITNCFAAVSFTVSGTTVTVQEVSGTIANPMVTVARSGVGVYTVTAANPNTWDGTNLYDAIVSSNLPQTQVVRTSASVITISTFSTTGVATEASSVDVKLYHHR